ncbi:MAG: hypothetical protein U0M51_03120 [Eggerthellaceae bacterium]
MAAIKPTAVPILLAAAAIALAALLPNTAWSDEPPESDPPNQESQNVSEEAAQGEEDPAAGSQTPPGTDSESNPDSQSAAQDGTETGGADPDNAEAESDADAEPLSESANPRSGTQVTVVQQGDSEPVVMEERKEPLADTGDETAAATVAAVALASLGAAVVAMKEPRGGAQP